MSIVRSAIVAMAIFGATWLPALADGKKEALPGNAIKREDILLSRALDDLERYLRMVSQHGRIMGQDLEREPDESMLRWAMRTHGLQWRDADDAFTFGRWRLAYLMNPPGHEALDNLMVRSLAAERIEEIFAEQFAGKRRLPTSTIARMRTYAARGREFEGHFPLK